MEERIKNLLDQTNLNWNVRTESIQTESGITIQDKIALVREDTNDIVGVHSDGYRPFQNQELFELLDKVSNMTGLELTKGGCFKEGRRVYVQMKSADLRLGNDLIKGYLTGINSFDGSTSLAFGPSNVTISCMNSFFAAFKQLNTKVRHTKNMVIRIDEICKGLEGVLAQEQVMFGDITRMSETRFDDVIKESVTRQLFGIKPEVDLYDNDAISTKTFSSSTNCIELYDIAGALEMLVVARCRNYRCDQIALMMQALEQGLIHRIPEDQPMSHSSELWSRYHVIKALFQIKCGGFRASFLHLM